ncbi:MAG: MraY family glycosyltransferase [Actinomycetota bacterium]
MPAKAPGRSRKLLPVGVLVVAVAVAGTVWSNLPGWLSTPDAFEDVDVIVVPAGEPDVRIPRAFDLLERDDVDAAEVWVLPSGSGPVLREPDAIEGYAKERGLEGRVEILRRSRSLLRDARALAARLEREERGARDGPGDLKSAVLSESLEIARTRLAFERETGEHVAVWRDRTRSDARGWFAVVSETTNVLTTLFALGPGPLLEPGTAVPLSLPLRALAGGLIVAFVVGHLCRPLARRLGLVSIPRLWRASPTPTPMLGGIAILAGLAGGILAAGGVRRSGLGMAAAVSIGIVALVGLIDDVAGLGARVRLMWAGAIGAVAWLLGLRALALAPDTGIGDVVNGLLTILWFMGITFAVNNLDNIDGAVGGVAAAAASGMGISAVLGGQYVVAVAAAALAGASLGFLVHSAHPARLYMGDMGALGLGFALAALALALQPADGVGPPLSMAIPVIALGVPIFDTVVVSISRIRAGSSPAVGGTDHVSHRLMTGGMSVRQAAAFLWGAQALLGVLAVAISRSNATLGWALVAVFVAAGLAALRVFLRMAPWKPPWQLQASTDFVVAVESAIGALKQIETVVGEEDWRLSNPRAARSAQETMRRLERVKELLEGSSKPPPPESPPGLSRRTEGGELSGP